MRLCLKSLLLAVVMLATEAYSCPAANASDDQISREIPHLRQLFQRYSGGHNALTLEDLQKLFQRLEFTLSLKENEGHSHHQGSSSQPPTNEKPSENDTHRHRQVGLHSYTLESPGDAQSLTNNNSNKNHPTYSSSMRQPVDYGSKHQTHDDEHDHHGKHRVHHEDDELLSNSTIKQYGVESTSREPVTKEIPGKTECSEGLDGILVGTSFSVGDSISVRGFLSICPGILNFLDVCTIDSHRHEHAADGEEGHGHTSGNDHSHGHDHSINLKSSSSADSWIGAVSSMVVIGLVGLACVMVIPVLKQSQYYDQVNHFLVALAVGTLAGDALIHLLPHAISMKVPDNRNVHIQHAFLGFTALGGIILFLFLERSHNMFCGHGHSHGHGHEPDLYASRSKEEIDDKETVETATTIEDAGSQSVDKIGEKLSRHSKHNSFIYAESTMSLDAQNCFEGCSSNVSPSSDANGNSDIDRTRLEDQMSSAPEKQVLVSALENEAEIASIEKQVAKLVDEKKLGTCATEKEKLVTSPVEKPELIRKLSLNLDTPVSGRHRVLRQNSSSFNMVLQEYHVGHHGHSHHGHSHVTGRKDSLKAVILIGDAMHTFLDGMAIGAAFGTSVTGGVATSIAVLCHELPHKVGDFALLFEMGMKLRQAVTMMGLLWLLSLAGLVLGVMLGSIQTASPWIYSFTAGVFIYLALVDLLSELSVQRGEKLGPLGQMFLQGLGMLTGALIMLFIAIYEHDLEHIIEGSF